MMGGNMGATSRGRNGNLALAVVKLTKSTVSRARGISTDPGCRM